MLPSSLDQNTHRVIIKPEVLKKILNRAVDSGQFKSLAASVASSDQILFEHACGTRDLEGTQPMLMDSIISIASMTKLVTTIAALQLQEKGLIGLDITADKYISDLTNPKILSGFQLNGSPKFRNATRAPTIRELMTHTSGYVYPWWNKDAKAASSIGLYGSLDSENTLLNTPLAFEPGTKWEYGIGIDILGKIIERITKKDLMSYFKKNIFEPLNMLDTSYALNSNALNRSTTIMTRKNNELVADSAYQPTLCEKPDIESFRGGGGLYSTVQDYGCLLRALLNKGRLNGINILSSKTIEMMFQNQIADLKINDMRTQEPLLTNNLDLSFDAKAQWGLGLLLHDQGTQIGRSPGSGSWAGFFNSYFWVDLEKDICGIFATQILPFLDQPSMKVFVEFEKEVYSSMEVNR